jgi:hypothetical protein
VDFAFRILLRLYPVCFRRAYEREMVDDFRELHADVAKSGLWAVVRLWARTTLDVIRTARAARRRENQETAALSWVDAIGQELRQAARGLRKAPGFSAVAILTLALGIGANTAVFTLMDAVMSRPLRVHEPHELVRLTTIGPTGNVGPSLQYPLIRAIAEQRSIFAGVCGFSDATFNVRWQDEVQATSGEWVTGQCYETLGLIPTMGRFLTEADDESEAAPVAVFSDRYWRSRFGRDPRVIGRSLRVGGSTVTIVGVSPPGFDGATVGESADLPLAVGVLPQLEPDRAQQVTGAATWLRVLARPLPGISAQEARARLAAAWPGLAAATLSDSPSPWTGHWRRP